MKVALVHDWLNQVGGAEDVLDVLVGSFPDSPIFTSIYAPASLPDSYRDWNIQSLWLDHLPAIHRRHQWYLPLYPLAWHGLQLSDYDIILSNKSGFCHGLRYDPAALHICYCLTPTRYVWQLDNYLAGENLSAPLRWLVRRLMAHLRRWDYAAAQRVSHFIAISSAVKERITRFYNRPSEIIHPPVDTARFQPARTSDLEDYYLIVSRLIPYKRIDLAVQAATALRLPLKVAGMGRDLDRLRAMAGESVEFLGYVPDAALPQLMAKCRALIFPGLEDFGITPVQAQAAGRPVIAYGAGGALDTVAPGVTGEFFYQMNAESLKAVWRKFDATAYNADLIRQHALQFDTAVFSKRINAFVEQAWGAHQSNRQFQYRDPVASDMG